MSSIVEPVRLPAAQIPQAGAVLARAFADDPLSLYVLPDPAHRARALPTLFTVGTRLGHLFGEVYTTAGTVAGSAVWLPPGGTTVSPEQVAAAGLSELAEHLGEAALARFGAVTAQQAAFHQRDMPDPHWYLLILGVDPSHQGWGIGGRLMEPVLARADVARLPCYLETTKAANVPFYQRHGFTVVVTADLPDGGLPFWTMRRSPGI